MWKKMLFMTSVTVFSLSVMAQGETLRVAGQPVELTSGEPYLMQPLWSPLGDRLAAAGANYQGLWIIHRENGEQQQICDLIGAGFLPAWSPDGGRIACRVSRMENQRRYSAIAVYDVEKSTATELTEYVKEIGLPQWIEGGRKLLYLQNGQPRTAEAPGMAKGQATGDQVVVTVQNDAIAVQRPPWEQPEILRPVEDRILWAELSPDAKQIAFEAIGAQLYVVDLDGTGLVALGRGERPRWSPDGQWITYMITEDDGYRMLSADIYAIGRDGSGKTAVTETDDRLEMNPHWSPDGSTIACGTRGQGIILLIPVEIEKDYPPQR
jgi:Tol biopolymer transport system component